MALRAFHTMANTRHEKYPMATISAKIRLSRNLHFAEQLYFV